MSLLTKRLRSEDGIVALETFFSVLLVITTTIVFWGVAAMLHNQAVLNGGTQLAAQESLMAYDRFTYSEGVRSNQALADASAVASDIYQESAHGLLDDQFKTTRPTPDAIAFSIACAPDYASRPGSSSNCGLANAQGRIETVTVSGGAPAATWMADFLNGVSYKKTNLHLHSTAQATSGGPCTSVETDILALSQCQ